MPEKGSQNPAARLRELRALLLRRESSLAALAREIKTDASHLRRIALGERRASARVLAALRAALGDATVMYFAVDEHALCAIQPKPSMAGSTKETTHMKITSTDSLRRRAARHGLRLQLSRARKPDALDYKGAALIDARTNAIVLGGGVCGVHSATLVDVVAHLDRLDAQLEERAS